MTLNTANLGPNHKLTLCRARDLATSHTIFRRIIKAKKLLNISIRRAKKHLGSKDLVTLRLYEQYGLCLVLEKEFKRPLKTFETVSMIREEVQGFGNIRTILSNKIKAGLLVEMNRDH